MRIHSSSKNIEFDRLKESISHVVYAVYADHPECFRYSRNLTQRGSVREGINNDEVVVTWTPMVFDKTLSGEEIKLDAALSEILAAASVGTNDYERVKIVYDYLADTITYDYEAMDTQGGLSTRRNSAYSALVEKKAVCGGYARAFQLVLNRLGIPCTTISGTAKGELHGWSIAMLDGEYYLFDVTWADQNTYVSYKYFAITTSELQKTHTFENEFVYPSCTATACNYYVKEGLVLEKYSFEELDRIVSAQNSGSETVAVKFTSVAEYNRAINDIISDTNWSKLAVFKDARNFRYIKDSDNLILELFLPTKS